MDESDVSGFISAETDYVSFGNARGATHSRLGDGQGNVSLGRTRFGADGAFHLESSVRQRVRLGARNVPNQNGSEEQERKCRASPGSPKALGRAGNARSKAKYASKGLTNFRQIGGVQAQCSKPEKW
jgi:hypothetical protein